MRTSKASRSLLVLLPLGLIGAGCAAATEGSASDEDALTAPPNVDPIGIRRFVPSTPALYSVQPYPSSVTVKWVSPDASATEFIVYRRDAQGTWQSMHTETNTPGKAYAWVDHDRTLSGQCYKVTAVNSLQFSASTSEWCTVRPDPTVFPQSAPSATVQWAGLSPQNDGVAPLESGELFLQVENQTWGIDLGLGHSTGNNVKAERQGTGSTQPLMKGEALAIRVWGAGWLTYGFETWGIDLKLSDTPSYEWYVVGDGTPGQNLDSGYFALYNKKADDYLVRGDQTWGVNLNWYKKTLPSTGGTGNGSSNGVRLLGIYDCVDPPRPVEMWVEDATAGGGFTDRGHLDPEWMDGTCPATGSPWTFTPAAGHTYVVRAIDYTAPGCSNVPDISSCIRLETTILGDPNGQTIGTTAD